MLLYHSLYSSTQTKYKMLVQQINVQQSCLQQVQRIYTKKSLAHLNIPRGAPEEYKSARVSFKKIRFYRFIAKITPNIVIQARWSALQKVRPNPDEHCKGAEQSTTDSTVPGPAASSTPSCLRSRELPRSAPPARPLATLDIGFRKKKAAGKTKNAKHRDLTREPRPATSVR